MAMTELEFQIATQLGRPGEPADVVPNISPRQLMIGLAEEGLITEEEAIAYAENRAEPAQVTQLINSLPEEQRFRARMTWKTMIMVERANPLVDGLATIAGKTSEEVNELFDNWSKIP